MTHKRNTKIFSLFPLAWVGLILLPGLILDGVRAVSSAPPDGYSVAQVSGGGTIAGKILYSGKPVLPKVFQITQDMSSCGKTKEIYPVKVQEGEWRRLWCGSMTSPAARHSISRRLEWIRNIASLCRMSS